MKPIYNQITYQNQPRIQISFDYNPEWNKRMGKIPGAKWSRTLNSWHIPDTNANRLRCGFLPTQVAANNQDVRQKLVEVYNKIQLKAYSKNTCKNYLLHLREYFETIAKKYAIELVTQAVIERYLLWRLSIKQPGESDSNSHINAIKFYYEQVLGRERMLFDLPRPKKPVQLPKVLGENELERLFRALRNIKHKTILLTAFSCGLRISEVINLKLSDIDSDRMQVRIERSKGKKDRYVMLSPLLLDVLRAYIRLHKPRPKVYLFEGQNGDQYSPRSAQEVFKNACHKAGIHKQLTFHSLRHSFATHLLEKGVDIKYIKDLLGHYDIKTTERYLHVAREKLVAIASPLDYLFKKETIIEKVGYAQLPENPAKK